MNRKKSATKNANDNQERGGGVGGRGEEKEGKRQKKVDGIEEDR